TFLAAGLVKGVIGLGLPTISLAILALSFDLGEAMALLLVPSLLTNFLQAASGGEFVALCKRLWLFMLAATVSVFFGAGLFSHFALDDLMFLLGTVLMLHALISFANPRLTFTQQNPRLLGPVFGSVNGVLTGMTGSFVVPGVIYLQSIGMNRDQLVQAMGILFSLSTIALALSLQVHNRISIEQLSYSAIGLLPALAGMFAGQAIRKQLSESVFRQVFFGALLLLGLYMVIYNWIW
ncbi:MAG: putative membrane protein YfcA, partial [Planctomycetota bacterium]